jgi:hypothetical protein
MRRNVLEEYELAARAQHARDLVQRRLRVAHRAEHPGADHGVRGCVLQRQALRLSALHLQRDARGAGGRVRGAREVLVGLHDGDVLDGGRQQPEVEPSAGADLDDIAGELCEERALALRGARGSQRLRPAARLAV